MEQHRLSKGRLLNKKGNLVEAGYAFQPVREYHRNDIKAGKSSIKEWDYYYVGDSRYGIALTIDDNSYMDLCSLAIFDYEKRIYREKSYMHLFSFGKRGLPETSQKGVTSYEDKHVSLKFINDGKIRHLVGTFQGLTPGKDVHVDIFLEETCDDTMVIATPFFKEKHFYYNQKINNLKARGSFTYDGKTYSMDDAYGVLDWGRGVWTRKNTWYWASMNGSYENHTIGFNLGYGFGDTSKASENMFFFDRQGYKLDDVIFHIPKENGKEAYHLRWKMTSQNSDIDLSFTPTIVRKGGANILIINSRQRQVFGTYEGRIKADGKTFEIHSVMGFAEKVYNKW